MENKFVPGVFAKQSKNPKFISVGVKLEVFKEYLDNLTPDDRGFVNFSMAKQLKDESKYSMWLDTWKPSKGKSQENNSDDDGTGLPF